MTRAMPKLFMMLLLFTGIVKADLIELKKDNFVSLREPINQDSSSRLLSKLNAIESKHEKLYIYINSPGGSVIAGLEIINYIKSLQQRGKQVNCIAHNASALAILPPNRSKFFYRDVMLDSPIFCVTIWTPSHTC